MGRARICECSKRSVRRYLPNPYAPFTASDPWSGEQLTHGLQSGQLHEAATRVHESHEKHEKKQNCLCNKLRYGCMQFFRGFRVFRGENPAACLRASCDSPGLHIFNVE